MKRILYFVVLCTTSIFAQTVTTFPGGTPDDGIAIDSEGNIYSSNFTGDKVFKYTTDGDSSVFIEGLDTPNGLAFDSNDNLYVCDWNANVIFRYDSAGIEDISINIPGNPSGMIKSFDSDDMIYTRFTANTINRITPDGIITEISSDSNLDGPVGLAYDEDGNLYVANFRNREIYRVLPGGGLDYIATVGSASNLGFIAYAQGMLWGTVLGEHKIYAINPENVDDVVLFAGSTNGTDDGDLSVATFSQPDGILFNEDETTMYVSDFGSKNLRVITDVDLAVNDLRSDSLTFQMVVNPSNNELVIKGTLLATGDYQIKAFNLLGQELINTVKQASNSNMLETIDISNWNSGTYIVQLQNGVNKVAKRFIKE